MRPSRMIKRFVALCLIAVFSAEFILPLQTIGQSRNFIKRESREDFGIELMLVPEIQKNDALILQIRRVSPEDQADFKKLPKLSQSDFEKLVATSQVRVVTDKSIADSYTQKLKIQARNRDDFARAYARRPDLVQLLSKGRNVANPAVTVKAGRTYALLNNDSMVRDLLLMKSYIENNQNQAKNYEYLYRKFQDQLKNIPPNGADKFKTLRTPSEVAGFSNPQINQAISQIGQLWLDFVNRTKGGGGSPKGCRDEEGTGNNGDSGEPCAAPNPSGLRARASWPLKDFNTCVRDQGNRGTCTAFGMSAAVESAVAVKYGRYVNLSEQDLYKKQKLEWFPFPLDFYGDGYNPAWSVISQMIGGYRYPFERDWDYNKSKKRCISTTDTNGNGLLDDPDPRCDQQRRYHRSCENYSNVNCSDTNHQARNRCYRVETKVVTQVVRRVCNWVESIPVIGAVLGDWVCDNVTENVEKVEELEVCLYETNIPGTSGFRVNNAIPFYAPILDPQIGVEQAKAFLASRTPIVFCFTVPESFGGSTSNGGFVRFDPNEKGDGGHCVLMTGFIDNKDLPAGIAPGEGGGYFIVKNSWGCDFGDQGYAYLPYSWVKKWGTEMIAVTDVS